jgi:hypothetical protein
MTTRNPQNPRNLNKPKGSSRKSAGSAKPKAKAASSVYVMTAEGKQKQQKAKQKQLEREFREQERKNTAIADKFLKSDKKYKKYRKIWIGLVVLAIVAVGVAWLVSTQTQDGKFLSSLAAHRNAILYIGMGVGYAALIAALVVDFKFVRKMRRAKTDEVAKLVKSGKLPTE